jgi:8-oxo-dGTP diphosphatase
MGEILFVFKNGFEHNCHLFLCDKWEGEPFESDEMSPKWFKINSLPFENMWETDRHWLPNILEGKRINAVFYFNGDAKTIEKFSLKEI